MNRQLVYDRVNGRLELLQIQMFPLEGGFRHEFLEMERF
jgi:hypothetical protein